MTKGELEQVQESWRTDGQYQKPAGMPVVEVEAGTVLDLDGKQHPHKAIWAASYRCQGEIRLQCVGYERASAAE
jgi:hypothetical protein